VHTKLSCIFLSRVRVPFSPFLRLTRPGTALLGGPIGIAGLLLAGAALQAAFPGSLVLAQELLPGRAGLASGMIGLTGGVGGLGMAFTGWLADAWTMGTALAATTLALIPAILLVSVLRREILRRPSWTAAAREPIGEGTQ